MEAERCGLHLCLIRQERTGGMFGKGYEEFFPVFADKSQHTRFIAPGGMVAVIVPLEIFSV